MEFIGHVVDEAGLPVAGARLRLGGGENGSDDAGYFEFTLSEQTTGTVLKVAVIKDGFEPFEYEIPAAGQTDAMLRLKRKVATTPTLPTPQRHDTPAPVSPTNW